MKCGSFAGYCTSILIAYFVFPSTAHGQSVFRYWFKSGEKIEYAVEQTTKFSLGLHGPINMRQKSIVAWHVVKTDQRANAFVTLRIKHLSLFLDGRRVFHFDSKKRTFEQGFLWTPVLKRLTKSPIQSVVNSRGKFTTFKLPNKLVKAFKKTQAGLDAGMMSEIGLQRIIEHCTPRFPKHSLSTGDSWTYSHGINPPKILGFYRTMYTCELVGGGKKNSNRLQKFQMTGKVVRIPAANKWFKILKHNLKGYFVFDKKRGLVISADIQQALETTVGADESAQTRLHRETKIRLLR